MSPNHESTTELDRAKNPNRAAERGVVGSGGPAAASTTRRVGGNLDGAQPSNTAPATCTLSPTGTQILRQGVDSLYLSYAGLLNAEVEARLDALKQFAQSDDPEFQALACFMHREHAFEVSPRGKGRFPYVLRDNWFHMQLSRGASRKMPMCYAQLGSELLTRAGVERSVGVLDDLVLRLGVLEKPAAVSRIDLCVDFTTKVELARISREAWVMRAHHFSAHHDQRHFSGFSFGMGGDLVGRLYDKTLEIKKSQKDYFFPLWTAGGWNGVDPVWRLEFQVRRNVLAEANLRLVDEVLGAASNIWQYAMREWLRLTEPSLHDSTQSRWPDHPLWRDLKSVDWGLPDAEPLERIRKTSEPSDQRLYVHGLGALTSYMAKIGEPDFSRALARYARDARRYHDDRSRVTGKTLRTYTREKAEAKAVKFNTVDKFEQGDA